jgi:hypothetical protein
MSRVNISIL